MTATLSLRIDFGPGLRLGPGKVELLEQIAATGSIAASGRAMHMSYRRAWELVEEINGLLGCTLVERQAGGRQGGGARLTPLGESVVRRFRTIEREAAALAQPHLAALSDASQADRNRSG